MKNGGSDNDVELLPLACIRREIGILLFQGWRGVEGVALAGGFLQNVQQLLRLLQDFLHGIEGGTALGADFHTVASIELMVVTEKDRLQIRLLLPGGPLAPADGQVVSCGSGYWVVKITGKIPVHGGPPNSFAWL
jgi:hypothetical protein